MGLEKFQPHQLNAEQMNQFLDLLLKMEETGHGTKARVGIKNRGYQNYFFKNKASTHEAQFNKKGL